MSLSNLMCGENISCLDKSINEMKICRPFLKKYDLTDDSIYGFQPILFCFPPAIPKWEFQIRFITLRRAVGLLSVSSIAVIFMILCDYFFTLSHGTNVNVKSNQTIVLFFFVFCYVIVFAYLAHQNFNRDRFCSLNFNESLCRAQTKYREAGALHSQQNPLTISSPCDLSQS